MTRFHCLGCGFTVEPGIPHECRENVSNDSWWSSPERLAEEAEWARIYEELAAPRRRIANVREASVAAKWAALVLGTVAVLLATIALAYLWD